MTYIAVVNASTRMPDADLELAVAAVAHQVRYDFAPHWGFKPVTVVRHADAAHAPADAYVLTVYDNADQADALGYHTEDDQGRVYGKVFAGPVLDNGGATLNGALSVSAVLSHEVMETVADPHVQLWSSDNQNSLYAYEVCDAVEDSAYIVMVKGQQVAVSNFVLPAFFDASSPAGTRLDMLGVLQSPFQIAAGGYCVKLTLGADANVQQVFGDRFAQWKVPGKTHALGRLARRNRTVGQR